MAEAKGMSAQEETNRLLGTLIRLLVPTQTAAILELNKSGFGPSRIAELLGTSSNVANVTIQQAKKKKPAAKRTPSKLVVTTQVEEGEV